jgi:probable phosphoglycerate mutase
MFAQQRWDVIPGAEPAAAFSARVRGAFDRIVGAHVDQRVVVVAHGGVIGEILAQTTSSRPWAFVGADNASVSHVIATPDHWVLRAFNDTSHLGHGLLAPGQA